MNMRLFACAFALTPVAAFAQTAPAPAAPAQAPAAPVAAAPAAPTAETAAPAPAAASRFIAAGTQVSLAALQELSSKHIKVGEHYQFTVVSDVTDNGVVVIPRGSMASGLITKQTGRGIGGKS